MLKVEKPPNRPISFTEPKHALIRILFVDDEQRILDGLKRTLHPMRDQWEMSFVASGLSALESLERQGFDVLVTDMRMPGMDGHALLSEVSGKYPHLVRLVLSGYSDLEHRTRSEGLAHSYLSKPCAVDELARTVQGLVAQRYPAQN